MPRTVSFKVYTIDEHPNKEDCFDYIRNNWHDLANYYIEEMTQSLEKLRDYVGGKLEYSISAIPDRGEYVRLTGYDAEKLRELEGMKDEFPLTGTCYDFNVIEGLANNSLDIEVLNTIHKETDYIYSDEGLHEMCEANEYEFYESGKPF